jgi:hypothetical protein
MVDTEWKACAALAPFNSSGDGLLPGAPCAAAFHGSVARYIAGAKGMLSLTVGGNSLDAMYNLTARFVACVAAHAAFC